MFRSILVTGSTGFVGQALVPALRNTFPAAQIHAAGSSSGESELHCDLTSTDSVNDLIRKTAPDVIIHLAAISHIPTSFENPELTWQVNLHGTLRLLNAAADMKAPCTFLQVGSGDCYGDSFKSGEPVTEDTAFKPMNPYAASKAAADLASYAYRSNPMLKIIRARPFNHTGAGQSNRFVVSAFAEQIARIEAGLQPPTIQVGNLDAKRCFLHLNDVIDAYLQLLQHSAQIDSGDAFNIVSDNPVSIDAVLQLLLQLSDTQIDVQFDPACARPSDIPVAQGDSSRLNKLTGWTPAMNLRETVSDVLDDWRNHYQQDN